MADLVTQLDGEAAMVDFGRRLAGLLHGGEVIYLLGDLGMGKTTLSRGVMRGLGYTGAVKSPTYTLVEPYEFECFRVYHFDLYRLGAAEELEYMGIRDYFDGSCVSLIEWPEKGTGFLPPADLLVRIEAAAGGRCLTLSSRSDSGAALLLGLGV